MNIISIFFQKCSIGNKTYFFYVPIYLFMSFFVLNSIEFFPDYSNYNQYIEKGTYQLRFLYEPFTALLMYYPEKYNWGALGYYYVVWFLSSAILFLIPMLYGRRYIVFVVFILFNPITIVLFQTPRQFISFCFFVTSLFFLLKLKTLFLSLGLLSHTISGFVSISFALLLSLKRRLFFISLIFGFFLFWYISRSAYSFYLVEEEIQRGVGRLAYFSLLFFLLVFLSLKKPFFEKLIFSSLFVFVLILYIQSPYAGRLLPYFLVLFSLYLFNSFSSKITNLIVVSFFLMSIVFSFFIVLLGMFGYG